MEYQGKFGEAFPWAFYLMSGLDSNGLKTTNRGAGMFLTHR